MVKYVSDSVVPPSVSTVPIRLSTFSLPEVQTRLSTYYFCSVNITTSLLYTNRIKPIPPITPKVMISVLISSAYALATHAIADTAAPTNIHTRQLNVTMTTLATGPENKTGSVKQNKYFR